MDWWLPVSHTTTAITDTAVKTELEQEAVRVKVLGPDSVQVTEMLDDKIAFLEEARSLNLPVPDYYQISSCQDVLNLCRQGKIQNSSLCQFRVTKTSSRNIPWSSFFPEASQSLL